MSNRHKNLKKCLATFHQNQFPISTFVEEILDQPIFLNPHTKLNFSSEFSIWKKSWLHFTKKSFPTPTSVEGILDKYIFKPAHQTGL